MTLKIRITDVHEFTRWETFKARVRIRVQRFLWNLTGWTPKNVVRLHPNDVRYDHKQRLHRYEEDDGDQR